MRRLERKAAEEELRRYLDDETRPVVFLIGKPQVGKTNLLCHAVEQRVANGNPVLFFPAISMEDRLSNEIARDFGWLFNGTVIDSAECWTRLQRVVGKSGKTLQLFVDGWNEGTRELVKSMNRDYDLFQGHGVQLVVSLTSTSCTRLLQDDVGNIESLAEACGIPSAGAIELLEVDPKQAKKRTWSVVFCDAFTQEETEQAYSKYAEAFSVYVPPTHVKTSDPYMLRIGMEASRNGTLPLAFDEPQLVRESIRSKAERVIGIDRHSVVCSLTSLSTSLLQYGGPLSDKQAKAALCLPDSNELPSGMFDAALLARSQTAELVSGVDFYYGRERDYMISHICGNWNKKLSDFRSLATELNGVADSNAGRDALVWFMSQPAYLRKVLRHPCDNVNIDDSVLHAVLLGLSQEYIGLQALCDFAYWCTISSDDPRVVFEGGRLLLGAAGGDQSLLESIEEKGPLQSWLSRVLTIGELDQDTLSVGFMDALAEVHCREVARDNTMSSVTEALLESAKSESLVTRAAATKCFGHVAPVVFFDNVAGFLQRGIEIEELLEGLEYAQAQLDEYFYGSGYCPSLMEHLDDCSETKEIKYYEIHESLERAIRYFPFEHTKTIRNLLKDLTPPHIERDSSAHLVDPNQLLLPFREEKESDE